MSKRFWSKVKKVRNNCWEWQAARTEYGYGVLGYKGRTIRAHRRSWEMAHKRRIPPGRMVLHRCDNPPCVNPAHLFLGTAKDNSIDMTQKGRYGGRFKPLEFCNSGWHVLKQTRSRTRTGKTFCRPCRLRRRRERKFLRTLKPPRWHGNSLIHRWRLERRLYFVDPRMPINWPISFMRFSALPRFCALKAQERNVGRCKRERV